MKLIEITEFLAQLDYERDRRNPPDELRHGRFKAGWRAATDRGEDYKKETLRILTWQNLGYRCGLHWGRRSDKDMDMVFQYLADVYMEPGEVCDPNKIVGDDLLVEGAVARVTQNAYERNSKARHRCIEIHGKSCCVCGIDFGQRYGLLAEGYIHVHHLKPMSEIGKEYVVDPEEDLRPICPNCHAVVHRRVPPFAIEEVKAFIRGSHPSKL